MFIELSKNFLQFKSLHKLQFTSYILKRVIKIKILIKKQLIL